MEYENTKNSNELMDDMIGTTESYYKKFKSELQILEKRRKNKAIYILILLLSIGVSLLTYIIYEYNSNYYHRLNIKVSGIIIVISIGIFLASIICILFYLFCDMLENNVRKRMFNLEIITAQENIEEDIFDNSLKLSYKYLDQYYNQTREQAQKGFLITTCVAIFGAILVFCGIIAMFFEKTTPSYITCASGVITEFIATIFFYLYNKTVSSMSNYHNKLVYSQNISFALKVADSLKAEDQLNAKNIIITELLKDINSNIKEEYKK